jgi:excinuclease ABC subunit A
MASDHIIVKGAKIHNLKNIDVKIPKGKFTVITGLSGSGKSSLAFDTIYAEGQRRYVQSLSTYARNFLQSMEKPDVESIEGLSPAISIDQKTAPRNPRSTVGTVTEIYDFLRLLFAKIGQPHDPETGKKLTKQSAGEIIERIAAYKEGTKIVLLAPVVKGEKGDHQKVFDQARKEGFIRIRVDGEIYPITDVPSLDSRISHDVELVIDRIVVKDMGIKTQKFSNGTEIEMVNPNRSRLADSVETALKYGEGAIFVMNHETKESEIFTEHYSSDGAEFILPEIAPRLFSFNSPHGACETCHGLGTKLEIDPDLVMPNKNLTIAEGAIMPWSTTTSHLGWYNKVLEKVAKENKFSINVPISELNEEAIKIILYGVGDKKFTVKNGDKEFETTFEGVIPNLERRYLETDSDYVRKKIENYMRVLKCPACKGQRLKPEVLAIKIGDKSIINITSMSVIEAMEFFESLDLAPDHKAIADQILQEVKDRLSFLSNVGLSYLTLDRSANTLSGGEAQRIRLATQIGSRLSGVIYVLDEPSIGLHQNDNDKLIKTLIDLRDLGNTVIVVEHDEDTMKACDYILDVGPGAGKHGGQIIAEGTPDEIMKDKNSVTGNFLSGKEAIEVPKKRRKGNGKKLEIIKASENNLRDVDVEFPLGTFIAVTGVSGSGKSSLINQILVKKVSHVLYGSKAAPGRHEEIKGIDNLDKIINIDQSPIGRTPRSNPATYTGVFTEIRDLFSSMPESKLRGYKSGRFSFNVKGGRCEVCQGDGIKKIEMHFLPDIYVPCESCKGQRYNKETLEIRYRGKNIYEILEMTVDEALDFFKSIPNIKIKLQTLQDVGLGYIHLGQSATTLSGGEAQRIKLATELSKRSTGKTLYVLDEPTTGLHFQDVKKLLEVLQKLVEKGNTVLVIEHNLDVVKSVDYVVDMGPNGGDGGGQVVAHGTPEEIVKEKDSYTGLWLKKLL